MLPVSMEDYSEPCVVVALGASVVIRGPGPLAGAFTPDAAEATGLLLIEAANIARGFVSLRGRA